MLHIGLVPTTDTICGLLAVWWPYVDLLLGYSADTETCHARSMSMHIPNRIQIALDGAISVDNVTACQKLILTLLDPVTFRV